MSKTNLTIKIPVSICEHFKDSSHYNWNLYRLPIYFNDRNILICIADDDRTEYFYLITEKMLEEKDFTDKLCMWARDDDGNQDYFEFEQRYFGDYPS